MKWALSLGSGVVFLITSSVVLRFLDTYWQIGGYEGLWDAAKTVGSALTMGALLGGCLVRWFSP